MDEEIAQSDISYYAIPGGNNRTYETALYNLRGFEPSWNVLCPTAKRACNRAWFSAKQVENWSGMTSRTLYNRLSELEEYQRISTFARFGKRGYSDNI